MMNETNQEEYISPKLIIFGEVRETRRVNKIQVLTHGSELVNEVYIHDNAIAVLFIVESRNPPSMTVTQSMIGNPDIYDRVHLVDIENELGGDITVLADDGKGAIIVALSDRTSGDKQETAMML